MGLWVLKHTLEYTNPFYQKCVFFSLFCVLGINIFLSNFLIIFSVFKNIWISKLKEKDVLLKAREINSTQVFHGEYWNTSWNTLMPKFLRNFKQLQSRLLEKKTVSYLSCKRFFQTACKWINKLQDKDILQQTSIGKWIRRLSIISHIQHKPRKTSLYIYIFYMLNEIKKRIL